MGQQKIAKERGILRSSISEILSKFQGIGSVLDRPTNGHPQSYAFYRITNIFVRWNSCTKVRSWFILVYKYI